MAVVLLVLELDMVRPDVGSTFIDVDMEFGADVVSLVLESDFVDANDDSFFIVVDLEVVSFISRNLMLFKPALEFSILLILMR